MLDATALNVAWREIEALPRDVADHRLSYGEDSLQFGELRLPKTPGPHPVVVFIHGGCWLNAFNLGHVAAMSRALANEGYAVWTPEYRRLGDAGSGWPGTFEDIAASVAILRDIAVHHALDLSHVVVMGHSAGGHLALWLGAQKNQAVPVHGVVSLAGICDLKAYERLGNDCYSSLPGLLGGTSIERPERWAQVNPVELLPFGGPVSLVHGDLDQIVPLAQSEAFAEKMGSACELLVVRGGGHFDMVSPHAKAWQVIREAVRGIKGRHAIT